MGRHTVRLVSRAGNQPVAHFWVVERSLDGFVIHHSQSDPIRSSQKPDDRKDDPSNPADPC
jgi:hypothetical protein